MGLPELIRVGIIHLNISDYIGIPYSCLECLSCPIFLYTEIEIKKEYGACSQIIVSNVHRNQ